MNAEDFIEIADYIKENYIPKEECFELDLYRTLNLIQGNLYDIARYLKKLADYDKDNDSVNDIDVEV